MVMSKIELDKLRKNLKSMSSSIGKGKKGLRVHGNKTKSKSDSNRKDSDGAVAKHIHNPVLDALYPFLIRFFPSIERNLELAEVSKSPKEYIYSSSVKAFYQSIGVLIFTAIGFLMYKVDLIYLIPLWPLYYIAMLSYNNTYLSILVKRRQRSIDFEIIYLLRYIIVSAKSGLPLYDSLVHAAGKYGAAGDVMSKVVKKAALGKTLSQALIDVAQNTPSAYMERVLIQLSNSLSSGSDISDSLTSLLNQISEEEMIQLKSYGRRLTPFTMFYMIFGIIVPSIGVVLSVVMLSIMGGSGFKLNGSMLALIVIILTVVQYLFLGMIKQGRPKYIV